MIRIALSSLVVSLFAVSLATEVSRAGENVPPYRTGIGSSSRIADCCWNADDYCRRPVPCAPCPNTGCNPECFVRRPLPAAPCLSSCATCDDYVRKCFPTPPWQCATPGLPRKIDAVYYRAPQPTAMRNPGVRLW